ncbi:helix-turn-helix domain-containing protein [Carnobacterium gallinarum]|uniref:helix-turn-helix domain-containing protein n=1 Tax=Carnobacterium gallinarum TaxID=2749 RepID=UPI00054E1BDF|nr:helix-turn-helix domain-containing protein [Carnobacterium gallinarum]
MMVEKILMDKATYRKYLIYLELLTLEGNICTVLDLATRLNYSSRMVSNSLEQISNDLAELGESKPYSISRNQRITIESLTVEIAIYRAFLISKSVNFRFIQAIAFKEDSSLSQFISREYLSESTLARRLKPIIDFLHDHGIKINLKQMSFVGDEKGIRIFLLSIYCLAFKGTRWPFITVSEDRIYGIVDKLEEDAKVQLGLIDRYEMSYFVAISILRISHHCYVEDASELDQICEGNPDYHPAIYHDFSQWIPQQKVSAELRFMFAASFFKPNFIEVTPRLERMIRYFKEQDNQVWGYGNEILNFLKQQFPDKEDELNNPILIGNLLAILLSNGIVGKGYINLFLLTDPVIKYEDNFLNSATEEFYKRIDWKKYPMFKGIRNQLKSYFIYLFSDIFEPEALGTTIKVGILYDPNILMYHRIHQFLKNSPYLVECCSIQKFEPEVDLIITATYLVNDRKNNEGPIIYYWNFEKHKSNFTKLLLLLEKIEKAKNEVDF